MTRDEGVALLMQQFSFRNSSVTEAAIVSNMQLAQTTLEMMPNKPWFLISELTETTTIPDDHRLPLPDDFLEELDEEGLTYLPDDEEEEEVQLVKEEIDLLKQNFIGVEPGAPQAYALVGEYFRIYPLPDDTYTVKMIYYMKDDTLDTNIENKWMKYVPLLLLGTAGKLTAKGPLRDVVANDTFNEWIQLGTDLLNRQNESRAMSNRKLQMGGPHA